VVGLRRTIRDYFTTLVMQGVGAVFGLYRVKGFIMITGAQKVKKPSGGLAKERNYSEVVEFLDSRRYADYDENVIKRMKSLDQYFDNVSSKIDTVLVGGTNGKSTSMHFAAKLLKEEGFKVGVAYSSHFLTYNERFIVDFSSVVNKDFTDIVNEVINAVELNNIDATTFEILTLSSLLYFKSQNVDVALLEVGLGGKFDATNFCNPKISAVTRIANDHGDILGNDLDMVTWEMLEIARPGSWFISAEQSKIRLGKMKDWIEDRGAKWAMPIRKLANLPYIYEQLYGRIASLGERIAQIYVEDIKNKFSPFLRGNLLATQKGQRGRPTLEAKRQAELNPIKTLKGFWNEQFDLLKGRFELLDKEKPSILLDSAHNLDAFDNLFLGVRLLHYQKPLKGLALIISLKKCVDAIESLKAIRYLLKKVSGQLYFVSFPNSDCHDATELVAQAKELSVKARACTSFAQAFDSAKTVVDERDGLICISGSNEMVSEYWKNREIKKL
jgi:dihydrofolate synthase / folylpolyglutamate synthase